jgi:hypothetical protein
MRKAGSAENEIFNKLSKSTAVGNTTQKTPKKKRKKYPKQRNATMKSAQGFSDSGERSDPDTSEVLEDQKEPGNKLPTLDVADILLGASIESVSLLGQVKMADTMVESQAAVNKSVQKLIIDTKKGNAKWRGKRTSGPVGDIIEENHYAEQRKPTNRRGDSQGVQADITHQDVLTERQLAADAGQNTVQASFSPTNSIVLDFPLSSPLETAHTHLSSPPSLPSTTPSQFLTPVEGEKGEVEVEGEQSEPGEFPSRLHSTPPEEIELEFRWPVSGDELGESGK